MKNKHDLHMSLGFHLRNGGVPLMIFENWCADFDQQIPRSVEWFTRVV